MTAVSDSVIPVLDIYLRNLVSQYARLVVITPVYNSYPDNRI